MSRQSDSRYCAKCGMQHEPEPRWLLLYSVLSTLLFAAFLLLGGPGYVARMLPLAVTVNLISPGLVPALH